jgi:hypothetical protein
MNGGSFQNVFNDGPVFVIDENLINTFTRIVIHHIIGSRSNEMTKTAEDKIMKTFTLYYRGQVLQDVVTARNEEDAMRRSLKVWSTPTKGTFVFVEDGAAPEVYRDAVERSKQVSV